MNHRNQLTSQLYIQALVSQPRRSRLLPQSLVSCIVVLCCDSFASVSTTHSSPCKGACAVRSAATAGIFHYYKVAELAGPSTILIHCMHCLAHEQLSSIQAKRNF